MKMVGPLIRFTYDLLFISIMEVFLFQTNLTIIINITYSIKNITYITKTLTLALSKNNYYSVIRLNTKYSVILN